LLDDTRLCGGKADSQNQEEYDHPLKRYFKNHGLVSFATRKIQAIILG
jgi:hypothetical protein